MMGFCRACRAYYDFSGRSNFDLKTTILNYWAFKNWQRIAQPIPANRVPLDILFGEPCRQVKAELEAARDDRLEIVTLFNQLAYVPKRPIKETLTRLELVRSETLEWATRPPSPFRKGQSHILNKMAESKEDTPAVRTPQVHETTVSALCGQTHMPTLAALCGEEDDAPPRGKSDAETWEKIKGSWSAATGRRTIPVIDEKPEPVSRWSNSTRSASIHPAEQSEELVKEEEILLKPVCFKPQKESEVLLKPVCYKPGPPDSNWI